VEEQEDDDNTEEPGPRPAATPDPNRIEHEFYDPRDFYDDDVKFDESDFAGDDEADKAYEVRWSERLVMPHIFNLDFKC
jgi:hypothetical protein